MSTAKCSRFAVLISIIYCTAVYLLKIYCRNFSYFLFSDTIFHKLHFYCIIFIFEILILKVYCISTALSLSFRFWKYTIFCKCWLYFIIWKIIMIKKIKSHKIISFFVEFELIQKDEYKMTCIKFKMRWQLNLKCHPYHTSQLCSRTDWIFVKNDKNQLETGSYSFHIFLLYLEINVNSGKKKVIPFNIMFIV
jgi:hypothetical protein